MRRVRGWEACYGCCHKGRRPRAFFNVYPRGPDVSVLALPLLPFTFRCHDLLRIACFPPSKRAHSLHLAIVYAFKTLLINT